MTPHKGYITQVFASLALTIVPSIALATNPYSNSGTLPIDTAHTGYSQYSNYDDLTELASSSKFPQSPQSPQSPQLLKLPDLGNGSHRFVEQREHKALGEWSLRQLNANAPQLNDPWVQEELTGVTWQLNSQVRTEAPLALIVVNDPNINAFAIPGGVIGINTGTILAADSMGEVASVLAHEVAHLSQRHYEHRSDADAKALLLQIATLVAGVAATTIDSDAATAIMAGGQTASQNSRMAFSRSNEREADRIGMQILAQSGYDPRSMPRFFATLNARSELNKNSNSFLPSFIMTHPLSSERLSEAQVRANSYPVVSNVEGVDRSMAGTPSQEQLFDLIKWRTAVLSGQVQETSLLTAASRSYGARLALATFYANKGRYISANNTLTPFNAMSSLQRQSYEPLLSITQAHIAGHQGQWDKAVHLLQDQHALYPERRDLRLYLADAILRLPLQDVAQTQSQIQRLLAPLIEQTPHDVEVLRRLQSTYEKIATGYSQSRSNAINGTTNPTNTSNLATLATIKALRNRSQIELWHAQYDNVQASLQQAKRLATQLQGTNINPKALIAKIDNDLMVLQHTQDYHP